MMNLHFIRPTVSHPDLVMGNSRASNDVAQTVDDALVDSICDAFESTWKAGSHPKIEDFVARASANERPTLLIELILLEYELRRRSGETPSIDEYVSRFPEHEELLRDRLARDLETAGLTASFAIEPRREMLQAGETWGRYQLLTLLGRGGFGEVWRARDPVLNRDVALKSLRPDKPVTEKLNQDLVREGQRLAQLAHEGIVRVLDAGIINDRAFLVSELKEGGTLQSRLGKDSKIERETAVRWMMDVAHALQAAHEQGFVHRDLKPGNLLFDRKGKIAVGDFGLAGSEMDQLTEPSGMMGTWAYASPEQARGDARLADPRSDLYSFGVIFYQLLTGRLPFVAQTVEQYKQQILEREPWPPRSVDPDIPVALETICLSCLRKEIANRPGSAKEVADGLEEWLSGQPALVVPGRSAGRRKWQTALSVSAVGVFAVALATAIAFGIRNANEQNPPTSGGTDVQPDWTHPKVIVWAPYNSQTDSHYYDNERGRYQFDTNGESLFQVGEWKADTLTLTARLRIHGPTRSGRAGMYWAWGPVFGDERITSCCWAVEVGHIEPFQQEQILVRQFHIGPSGGYLDVLDRCTIWHEDISLKGASHFELTLKATEFEVQQIHLNGEAMLDRPIQLKHALARDWQFLRDTAFGFTGLQGTFSVDEFLVE